MTTVVRTQDGAEVRGGSADLIRFTARVRGPGAPTLTLAQRADGYWAVTEPRGLVGTFATRRAAERCLRRAGWRRRGEAWALCAEPEPGAVEIPATTGT